MAQNAAAMAAQYVFKDFFWGIFYFPFWWYTRGLMMMIDQAKGAVRYGWRYSAVGVWVKNWLVPMYGDASWQGRIVSVFMRTAMIFGRGFLFIVWTIVVFFALLAYVFIFPVAMIGIFYHGIGVIIG